MSQCLVLKVSQAEGTDKLCKMLLVKENHWVSRTEGTWCHMCHVGVYDEISFKEVVEV